jgi:hypothetical protein
LKDKIEQHLQHLIGLKLTSSSRAANMECLKFGDLLLERNSAGEEFQIGEYGLHLQCPWRITDESKILIGWLDLYEPIDENAEYDENFDWDRPNGNLRDSKIHELIKGKDLLVTFVVADNFGGFDLLFNGKMKLSVFPAYSKSDEYSEHWRLLSRTPKYHFVVSNSDVNNE